LLRKFTYGEPNQQRLHPRYRLPVRRLGFAAASIALALALAPAAARASAYTDVLHVYQAEGSIPPCRFSSAELAAALKGIDTYGQQYFADFTEAVQSALIQRASGACTRGLAVNLRASGTGTPLAPLPPSATAATDAGIPAPILAMAALGIALALIAGLSSLARSFGWDPEWAAAWRHAWGEASYRVGGGLDEFADWWRSGR
jgi:hypothetical protein